jgi:Mce-associated membrane protein
MTERPDVLAELAEAEAAEAEARAEADAAKSRADELRRTEDLRRTETEPVDEPLAAARPRRRLLGLAAVAVPIGAAVALTGLMLWQHSQVAAQRAWDSAVVEAAGNGVVALLSIDHSRAKADVQRVLDLSTGAFRDDFAGRADDFIKTAEGSKAVTKGAVSASALDSADADNPVVLVAATSQVTNSGGARDDPRPWRMSVTMTRDADQWKMSNVEFVP